MRINLKRHIFDELVQWKTSSNAKPLILRGARQVGKTTLVHSFGESYTYFVELNLEKIEDAHLVERSNSVQELVKNYLIFY